MGTMLGVSLCICVKSMAGGSLVALEKNKPNCPLDVHLVAVVETLRQLASKCICAIVKNKASEFFFPSQLGEKK